MDHSPVLHVPTTIWAEMIAHARAEAPNECVGLLVGTADGQVVRRLPLVNELAAPTRFRSEARSMFAAEKARRAAGLEVLAVYHSHPTSAPVPSKWDHADHLHPDIVCIIVSLLPPEAKVAAWWLRDGRAESAQLVVV